MDTKPFCDIQVIDNFLPQEFVDGVLAIKDQCEMESTVVGGNHSGFRNCSQLILPNSIPLIHSVRQKIALYLNVEVPHQEALTLLRYKEGGFFKAHMDAFVDYDEQTERYHKETEKNLEMGQRVYSVLMGIQTAEEGGETHFPAKGKTIKLLPKQAIYWNNAHEGKALSDSTHEGLPIIKGEKLVVVCWVRDKPL